MTPIYDLGLVGQTILAALVVLVAVWWGHAPLGIVAVFFVGLEPRSPMRPDGRSPH